MKMRTRERLSSITMVERSDQRMERSGLERSGLERSGHGTKWPLFSWGIGYTERTSNADVLMSTPEMDERSRRLLLLNLVHQ